MTVLRIIIDNSLIFSLLFLGIWFLKALLKKHLSARLHYVMWAVVLISLLIPVQIQSQASLWNLLPVQKAESVFLQPNPPQAGNPAVSGSNATGGAGIAQPGTVNGVPDAGVQPVRTQPSNTVPHIGWPLALLFTWLAGAAAIGMWFFLGGLRRRQIARCGLPDTPSWLKASAGECAKALNMRRSVRIVLQPVLPMPFVMGAFRPTLAMPKAVAREENGERVRHILMHEFSHVRRGDLWVIAFMNALNAVYWFNPLVWICFRRIREDMETYCDNEAVNALGIGRRQEYIRTLIHFSGMSGHSHAQAALSLNDASIKMKRRIGAMFMPRKTKPAVTVTVLLLAFVLLLAATATGCLPVSGSGANPANLTPSAVVGTQAPTPGPSAGAEPTKTPEATAGAAESPAPAAAQWESLYQTVLDEYRRFAKSFTAGTAVGDYSEWGVPWDAIAPDMAYSSRNFGYAFRDMDGNGISELFLLTDDGTVWAMYTIAGNAPILLEKFWARNTCVLDRSDIIYTNWSSGALDNGRDAYRISKDGRGLSLVERVAMESTDETGNPLEEPRFYKCVGSEADKQLISKEEADAEMDRFPQSSEQGALEFMPLK